MTQSAPPPPPPAGPPPPPPSGPHNFGEQQAPDVRKDNPIALASLVVSVAALLASIVVIGGLIGLIAIVMAGVGLTRSKDSGTGRGFAIGAIVLSLLSLVASAAAGVILFRIIEDGSLTPEGFNPNVSSDDFPVDDDLVSVECTEDGLALAVITVENNTETNQRYSVTVTWETDLGEVLTGEARSDFVEPGDVDEVRIFERSSAALIDSCELTSFTRSASILD